MDLRNIQWSTKIFKKAVILVQAKNAFIKAAVSNFYRRKCQNYPNVQLCYHTVTSSFLRVF